MNKKNTVLHITITLLLCVYTLNSNAQKKSSKKTSKKTTKTTVKKEIKNTLTIKKTSKKSKTKNNKQSKQKTKKTKKKKRTELDKVKDIEKVLNYGINKQRKDAIKQIRLIKKAENRTRLFKKLIKLLKYEYDSAVKINAINVLGDMDAKIAIPAILKQYNDRSQDVKIAATYALKNLKATDSKKLLISELKKMDFSENNNYTEALIDTLGTFKSKELIPFIQKKIDDTKTTRSLRGYMVIFLGKSESKKSKDFLIKLLKDDDEDISLRSYAANSLSKLGIKEAAKPIKDILSEIDTYPFKKKRKYYTLQIYCVASLARLGDKDATPRLINNLKSNNAYMRLRAAKLLGELKDKSAIEILKYKVKYDPNKKVRRAAKNALKDMGLDKEGKPLEKKKDDKKDKKTKIKPTNNSKKIKSKKTTKKK